MSTILSKKEMSEEDIKLQYITPAITRTGQNVKDWMLTSFIIPPVRYPAVIPCMPRQQFPMSSEFRTLRCGISVTSI